MENFVDTDARAAGDVGCIANKSFLSTSDALHTSWR